MGWDLDNSFNCSVKVLFQNTNLTTLQTNKEKHLYPMEDWKPIRVACLIIRITTKMRLLKCNKTWKSLNNQNKIY